MVLISLGASSNTVEMTVKDTGVGITQESQSQIFGGFYHAKETDLYSTKKPFDFDAGGKGLELLRVKIFEEVYQFKTECESTRCGYIPGESDLCPGGDISMPLCAGRRAMCPIRRYCFQTYVPRGERPGCIGFR